MKLVSKIKRIPRRVALLGAVTAALLGAGLFMTSLGSASADPSCNTDSVISGGISSKSQIETRYNSGVSGCDAAFTIQHIYSWFGISQNDIKNMSDGQSDVVMGSVTSDGNVIVNGKVVATNAVTAGHTYYQNKYGKSYLQSYTYNGAIYHFYTRTPKVSFAVSSISAFVVMENGQFKFALLTPCGNPIKATPVPAKKPCPQPVFQCTDLKADQDSYDEFTFTAQATASNGATIAGYDFDFGDGNGQTVNTTSGTASVQHTYAGTKSYNVTVSALIKVNGTVQKVTSANCATTVKPCPPPAGSCDELTSEQNSRATFTFNAKGSVSNGPVILGYVFDFGDGNTQTVKTAATNASIKHTYNSPNTYNANVTVLTEYNGVPKNFTSAACATTVKVCPPPAAECTDVKLLQNAGNPREVSMTVDYTASNGASLKDVSINWGDSTVVDNGTNTTAQHTYGADGTYTVAATLTFSADSNIPASTCQSQITVTTVTPTCDELTIDSDNATKTVTIGTVTYTANDGTYEYTTVDFGDGSTPVTAASVNGVTHTYTTDGPFTVVATAHFTVNGTDTAITSGSCQQPVSFTQSPTPTPPVTPPTTLVNTGAGNVIGMFVATTIVGAIGYHLVLSRRASRQF